MRKTTVYLPEELRAALGRASLARWMSEVDLIRKAIRELTENTRPPNPTLPLFGSGDPGLAERVDRELAGGFGEG